MRLDALAACVAVAVTMLALSAGLPVPAWGQAPPPPAQPQPPMQQPVQPPLSPVPPPPADPRLAQVRTAVERLGQKVLDGASEPPDTTVLVNGQVWNRFIINQFVKARDYATFLSSYQAARNDAERARAFDVLWDTTKYSVFDIERGQYVDARDFSNKNFTR
jgi:hypothetical protein